MLLTWLKQTEPSGTNSESLEPFLAFCSCCPSLASSSKWPTSAWQSPGAWLTLSVNHHYHFQVFTQTFCLQATPVLRFSSSLFLHVWVKTTDLESWGPLLSSISGCTPVPLRKTHVVKTRQRRCTVFLIFALFELCMEVSGVTVNYTLGLLHTRFPCGPFGPCEPWFPLSPSDPFGPFCPGGPVFPITPWNHSFISNTIFTNAAVNW